ncbi:malonate decarboxylase acyl carrier protein [bacterium D16-54]|nr:malonate decarboxylase acyl carrier protein [bacterium D16-54]RKJ16192.1 malonate decarboxylase acyl carrier protein [bacterium D16-56]
MALQELNFSFKPEKNFTSFTPEWFHSGVVGSGDMEVLMERRKQDGRVTVKVVTPVTGFDQVWEKVLGKFVADTKIGNLHMEINDNNATPFIVHMRLKQALFEAKGDVES